MGIELTKISEDLVSEHKSLSHEHSLIAGRERKESLVGYIVYILDGDQLFLHIVQIVDERTMTGRAEKQTVIFFSERTVLHIHGDGVRSLVLESEGDIVFHPIPLFIALLYFGQGGLKERTVFR